MAGEQRSKGESGVNVNRAKYVCLGAWEKWSRELKYHSGMEHEGPVREGAQAADPGFSSYVVWCSYMNEHHFALFGFESE